MLEGNQSASRFPLDPRLYLFLPPRPPPNDRVQALAREPKASEASRLQPVLGASSLSRVSVVQTLVTHAFTSCTTGSGIQPAVAHCRPQVGRPRPIPVPLFPELGVTPCSPPDSVRG